MNRLKNAFWSSRLLNIFYIPLVPELSHVALLPLLPTLHNQLPELLQPDLIQLSLTLLVLQDYQLLLLLNLTITVLYLYIAYLLMPWFLYVLVLRLQLEDLVLDLGDHVDCHHMLVALLYLLLVLTDALLHVFYLFVLPDYLLVSLQQHSFIFRGL